MEKLHRLKDTSFLISYIDPSDQDLLPINNDENLRRALFNAKPLLRVIIQRKGIFSVSVKRMRKCCCYFIAF